MERPQHTPEDVSIPEPLPVNFAGIPEQLQEYQQWVVWKYHIIDGEIKKPPFSPTTGRVASVRNPSTWGSFAAARSAYETGQFNGVGLVLTAKREIVALDLDHCIIDGQIAREAHQIITALNSYTEYSPSGAGIRVLLAGKLPGAFRRQGAIELYEDLRYVTVTGQWLEGTPHAIQPRHRELYSFYQRIFGQKSNTQPQENTGVGGEHQPAFHYHITRSDQVVIHKALSAKNSSNFKRYYTGDSSLWEGTDAKHSSQSEADFTLALMLLYWTNGDTAQVDRLFRQSGLYREKWDRPIKGNETYGERMIKDAISKRRY